MWSWSPLACAEKTQSRGSGYMCILKHVYFNIFVHFIVDTTSILKLVFPTAYCFCLGGHLGGCVFLPYRCCCWSCWCCFYLFCFFIFYLFIYLSFCFDRYSHLCCRCCHRYCCWRRVCCWCHRYLLCLCGYHCCKFNANVFNLGFTNFTVNNVDK